MRIHTFGKKENPAIILIHGVWIPWQCWDAMIEHFQKKYYVLVPALSAHEQEEATSFHSFEEEAKSLYTFLTENHIDHVYALMGISMGGCIASVLYKNYDISIQYLILDGAPLVPVSKWLTQMMSKNYKKLLVQMKNRNSNTLNMAEKNYLSKEQMKNAFPFLDTMKDSSIENMMRCVGENQLFTKDSAHVLYLHGTLMNEYLSKATAKKINATILTFPGYGHAKLFEDHDKWIQVVEDFMKGK